MKKEGNMTQMFRQRTLKLYERERGRERRKENYFLDAEKEKD